MNLFDLPIEELREYKPELTKEKDFDDFWEGILAESDKYPLNDEVKPAAYPIDTIKVYDIYFDGFRNSRIHGRLVLPKGASAENKVPVVVYYHGYNWNNLVISHAFKFTVMGYGCLMMDVRGQDVESPDHNHYGNGGACGWMTKGILDHNNYYYLYAFMDSVRAIEFIKTREEIDVNKIAVEGGSQGGGLSLAVGALSKDVKVVMADIPYLCHFRRSVRLSTEGPYNEIYHYFKIHDSLHRTEDQVYRTLSYFDGMNLATRIKAKTLISVGLEDTVCPPSTCFAAYNHINAEKEIRVYPEYAHGGFTAHEEEKIAFIKKIFG
ncbi:acetylxylan esterase [Clostridium thermarum]|uniref:acetylxylan esterase n=1 Tax=Clostridium thermarum TaxID=1716543 RepID=UPI00111E9F19|nr:acetylxylan esterase [Clostridium thermarum]